MANIKQQNNINNNLPDYRENSISNAEELSKRVVELDEELKNKLTREITILFTDIKGSTTFFRVHGDIAGRLMMQRHYDMHFPIITQHDGAIVKTVGDSIMASFDDPHQAVKAAIEMQRRLSEYNASLPQEEPIIIRIGINFGRGIIEENDVYGNVVNVASKLVSIGDPEQILVSESIYNKLHPFEDLFFSPIEADLSAYDDLELKIYEVRWQEEDKLEKKEMTTVSFALMDRTLSINDNKANEKKSTSPERLSSAGEIIKKKAFRATVDPEWRLQAIFEDAETAVKTVLRTMKRIHQSDQNVHIGIHTGSILIGKDEIRGGEEADEAREKAGTNEIYITSSTYESIKDNPLFTSLQIPACLSNGTPLHKIIREPAEKRRVEEPRTIAQKGLHSECFYCSSRNHHVSSCPSKSIPFHTRSLNEISYLSPAEIKSLYAKHFPKILLPYNTDQEEVPVPLLSGRKPDLFKASFEAFYEVNEILQLRFLRNMWGSEASSWDDFALSITNRRSGGFLWLGEDSLRVSKLDNASTMLTKALEHNPGDYRPYTALGFLAVETGNLSRAIYQFRRALPCTDNPLQKSYVFLLLSRVYELDNNLEDALKSIRDALVTAPKFLEARYRQAVLLAKNGDTDEAISILKALASKEPDYYLKMILDPGLNPIRREIDLLTREFFEQARINASNNIKTIKANLLEHGEWFSKEDPEYKTAEKIFSQTLKLLNGNSYFGYLDVIAYGFDIKDKLQSALRNRRRAIRKSINTFRTILEEYDLYLERYFYKNLISYSDTSLLGHYRDILDRAKRAVSIESAESLKEAQTIIKELPALTRTIVKNEKKLNFLKMVYFTSGCFAKFSLRFLLWSFSISSVSCIVLITYQAYSNSLYDFSTSSIADYVKFSSFFGTLFGAGASIYWLYKNFDNLYSRLR
jgi:class 3 adenylate cyclase/tetratricopeptide (TPR) repeat protein